LEHPPEADPDSDHHRSKGYSLVPHTSMDQKYEDLRFLARQYDQRMGTLTTNKVFLINLLDETMPGIAGAGISLFST